jgi:hypothetical protein
MVFAQDTFDPMATMDAGQQKMKSHHGMRQWGNALFESFRPSEWSIHLFFVRRVLTITLEAKLEEADEKIIESWSQNGGQPGFCVLQVLSREATIFGVITL